MCTTYSYSFVVSISCQDYRIEFYYWEVIELIRRTVIVGWVLLIPTSESFLRLVVALLLSIASLTLLLTFQPYKVPADNVLAGLCQLTIAIVFIGATLTPALLGA